MSGPAAPRRRRHRRVDAPPTNAEADRSDDVPARPRDGGPQDVRPHEPPQDLPPDARDAWIRAQRPPHWD